MSDKKEFMVEGATIIFRNFSGKEGPYNKEGDRSFAVILDEETAEKMLADGWNVRMLRPREEDDVPVPYISVAVNFNNRPPRVVMITSSGRTPLDESSIGHLDYADFANVDLIARGYEWSVNGKGGVKAYLQSLFVTIAEDALELKYATTAEEDDDL